MLTILITSLGLFLFSACDEPPAEEGLNSIRLGGNCYLEIANTDTLRQLFMNDFSIEIWVKGDTSLPDTQRTLFMGGNNDGGDELTIFQGADDSSLIEVYIDDQLFGDFSIPGTDWREPVFHHICVTQSDEVVSFYFDGDQIQSRYISGLMLDIGQSNLLIGGDYNPPGLNAHVGKYWIGNVDEVRLWKRSISASEVSFHADHPDKLLRHYSAEDLATLVGLWRFNSEYSDKIPDESGCGNIMTIRGIKSRISWAQSGA